MTPPASTEALTPRPRRRAVLGRAGVLLLALGASLVTPPGGSSAADAATCKPTPGHLTRLTPVTRNLAGGAQLKAWDTGATPSNPRAATRIVAVRIPAASPLKPYVGRAGTLTTSRALSTYTTSDTRAILAVNGDFFDAGRRSLPIHAQMRGGRIDKGASTKTHVVVVDHQGRMRLDQLGTRGSVTVGGKAHPVTGLNWQSVTGGGVNVYTTAWGGQRRPHGTTDVVVAGGKVVAVRTGTARGAAPTAGQTILTAGGTVLSGARVGQAVTTAYGAQSASGLGVRDAVGHGARYLRNGSKDGGSCGSVDEQLRPRTAIGWTKSGDTIILTVSGRSYENGVLYGGATTHQMPDYLAQLGAYNAVALDGGGSTTMMARTYVGVNARRVDHASPLAPQRPIPNSIVFK